MARRTLLLFGANTDVGKTCVSGGLMLAALRGGARASFLKPLQTGPWADHDELAIARACQRAAGQWGCTTLHTWPDPLSPHLAATLTEPASVVADALLLEQTQAALERLHAAADGPPRTPSVVVLETAGGVLSPSAAGTPQADVYAPLAEDEVAIAVLVGDATLGGISTTLASYEALARRGYRIDAVALERGTNADYLEQQLGFGTVERLEALPESGPLDAWHVAKGNAAAFERIASLDSAAQQ